MSKSVCSNSSAYDKLGNIIKQNVPPSPYAKIKQPTFTRNASFDGLQNQKARERAQELIKTESYFRTVLDSIVKIGFFWGSKNFF